MIAIYPLQRGPYFGGKIGLAGDYTRLAQKKGKIVKLYYFLSWYTLVWDQNKSKVMVKLKRWWRTEGLCESFSCLTDPLLPFPYNFYFRRKNLHQLPLSVPRNEIIIMNHVQRHFKENKLLLRIRFKLLAICFLPACCYSKTHHEFIGIFQQPL